LDRYLTGKIIRDIKPVNPGKVLQTPLSFFKRALVGKKVRKVFRRAKMLIIDCGQEYIVFHLKMTGQLIYKDKKTIIAGGHPIVSTGVRVPNSYTRMIFTFSNNAVLYFNDLRKFGWVKLVAAKDFSSHTIKVGPEPLDKNFTFKMFQSALARRSKTIIKAALLDQSVIAGLGNIYVDEVLFRAGVRPSRRVQSLKLTELKKIFQSIPIVLNKSISERGTTFSNFLDPDGLRGNFVSFLKVYGRTGKACSKCGRAIKKTRLAGRGTHWCEYCQN
jgi:formamidopyrimidine-DNA glycosylase